jgi:hypothetical protein
MKFLENGVELESKMVNINIDIHKKEPENKNLQLIP